MKTLPRVLILLAIFTFATTTTALPSFADSSNDSNKTEVVKKGKKKKKAAKAEKKAEKLVKKAAKAEKRAERLAKKAEKAAKKAAKLAEKAAAISDKDAAVKAFKSVKGPFNLEIEGSIGAYRDMTQHEPGIPNKVEYLRVRINEPFVNLEGRNGTIEENSPEYSWINIWAKTDEGKELLRAFEDEIDGMMHDGVAISISAGEYRRKHQVFYRLREIVRIQMRRDFHRIIRERYRAAILELSNEERRDHKLRRKIWRKIRKSTRKEIRKMKDEYKETYRGVVMPRHHIHWIPIKNLTWEAMD